MDAHALLTAQGWRGHGHSLHQSDDSIGLAKPLLLNRKSNTKGLGVAQHFNNDQWWLSAFDEQLKGLEMTESGGLRQTVSEGKLNVIQKGPLGRWSVYTSFVKGGFLNGTMSLLEKSPADSSVDSSTTGESSDGGVKSQDDSGNSNSKSKSKTNGNETTKKETKEERRARKEAKRKRKEERAKVRAARQARKEAKANGTYVPSKDESRDEKRRRREKKEEKRRKREEERNKKASSTKV